MYIYMYIYMCICIYISRCIYTHRLMSPAEHAPMVSERLMYMPESSFGPSHRLTHQYWGAAGSRKGEPGWEDGEVEEVVEEVKAELTGEREEDYVSRKKRENNWGEREGESAGEREGEESEGESERERASESLVFGEGDSESEGEGEGEGESEVFGEGNRGRDAADASWAARRVRHKLPPYGPLLCFFNQHFKLDPATFAGFFLKKSCIQHPQARPIDRCRFFFWLHFFPHFSSNQHLKLSEPSVTFAGAIRGGRKKQLNATYTLPYTSSLNPHKLIAKASYTSSLRPRTLVA
jgi:hypothetical protein